MKSMRSPVLTLALAAALCSPVANAATITIVNQDGPGEGFNDATPRAPLPSNPGTTLGAQRLFVFQQAANQWGRLLDSAVEIRVRAAFNPLTCSGTSAVLGSAGAAEIFRDFPNAPSAGRWYSVALANSLAGSDLNAANEDINSQFNVDIDNGVCLTGITGWSYATRPEDVVAATTPLLPVVFHELAHGLGFQTFVNNANGSLNAGFPDQWTQFLRDEVSGQVWDNLSNAQRQASAISDPNLTWVGPTVEATKASILLPAPRLIVNSPAGIAGLYAAQIAGFGPAPPTPGGLTNDVVLVIDPTAAASINDGCETPFVNAALVAGKIALIERGTCTFVVKVKNAQLAGAVGVIIQNNQAGLPPMGGSDLTITIPSYGISTADGTTIRNQVTPVNATLGYDPSLVLAGTTNGRVRMHAPNPLVTGSSVSHFTLDAFPNLLMEPSLSTAFSATDLTVPLFRDIGWQASYIFSDSFE